MVTRVTGEHRFDVRPSKLGLWAAPLMGMAFAFAWTPCIGPVLGVVLGLAAKNGTLTGGVVLLFAYSLGLAVPFVVTGLAFERITDGHRPGPARALGGGAGRRHRPGCLRRAAPDRQRQLGLDAAVQPLERPRARTALDELRLPPGGFELALDLPPRARARRQHRRPFAVGQGDSEVGPGRDQPEDETHHRRHPTARTRPGRRRRPARTCGRRRASAPRRTVRRARPRRAVRPSGCRERARSSCAGSR